MTWRRWLRRLKRRAWENLWGNMGGPGLRLGKGY